MDSYAKNDTKEGAIILVALWRILQEGNIDHLFRHDPFSD